MQVGSLIPGEVVRHPELTDTDRIIFGLLFQFRLNGKAVFPSNAWLSDAVGRSVRTIQRSLSKLQRLGLLTTRMHQGRRHLEISLHGIQNEDEAPEGVTPVSQGVTPVSGGGDTGVTHNKRSLRSLSIERFSELFGGDLPEHVRLKDTAVDSLLKDMTPQELRYWIFVLDSYIPNAKKPYKDHAAAIRSFRRRSIEEGKAWNGRHYAKPTKKTGSARPSSSAFADEYFAQQSSEDMSDAIDVT